MEGNFMKNHEELMTQFRGSVRANIKQLQNYGVATKYEDYLEEPQFEELPRMRDIGVKHFYGGGYVEEHDYKPLTGFSSIMTSRQLRGGLYRGQHDYKTLTGFRRHKTQEIRQSGDLLGMRDLFSSRVQQFRDTKFKKNIRKTVHADHVMILGPAGSGKSTIMKRFARDADAGRIPQIQEADRLVHALDARRFDPRQEISVHEFLFRNMTNRPSDDAIRVGYNWMLLNPGKVVLAVDSLDTLGYSLDDESDAIGPASHARPATILYNIFTGNLFPGCKILSSSREHQVRNYEGDLRARKIISLAGLTTESIQRLVSGFLGPSEGEKVYKYLQKFPGLLLLCQTPIFLVFSLVGVKFLGADGSEFVPNTMTGVMVNLLLSLIRSKHARTFKKYELEEDVIHVLTKMKELSYNGTKQGKVLFSESDLQDVKLSTDEVTDVAIVVPGSGQSESKQRVLDGDSVTYFAHQSIEEMLCAMYIAEMTQAEFQSFVSEFLHKPYFAVIRRFLCGLLLDPKVYEVASIQLVKVENLTMFREQLTASLKKQLQRVEDEDRLELYYSLHESGVGATDIIPAMERFSFKPFYTTLDMFTIGSVLHHCTKLEVLDMRREQATHFRSGLGTGNLKISTLILHDNTNLGVEGLKSVGEISKQSQVEELDLRSCKLTPPQLEALKVGLDSTKISTLVLDRNTNMGVEGLKSVGEISKQSKVEELELASCNFYPSQLEALKDGLDSAKLRKLNISLNEHMGISGLEVVGQIVRECNVEELDMHVCDLKNEAIMSFKKGLAGAKLKKLDVSQNNIGTEGFRVLADIACESGIIELDIRNCRIHEAEIQRLFGQIPGLKLRYGNFPPYKLMENPAVASPTATTGFREEHEQMEQQHDTVTSPTVTAGSREGDQQTEQQHKPVASPAATTGSREKDRQIEQQHDPDEATDSEKTDDEATEYEDDEEESLQDEYVSRWEWTEMQLEANRPFVVSTTDTAGSKEEDQQTEQQHDPVSSPAVTVGSREEDEQTEQQHDPVVGPMSMSPSDSPKTPTDLQMREKQSCGDVDLGASEAVSPTATVSSRVEDQQTEQHYDPAEPPMKLTDQQLSPLASDTFAKMSSESRRKIEHDKDVVAMTFTSPSDSQGEPIVLQMQEKQSCSDVDLNASAVESPTDTTGSRKEDQQTEQQHDPVASPTATTGSREEDQKTEQQHDPVASLTVTAGSREMDERTEQQHHPGATPLHGIQEVSGKISEALSKFTGENTLELMPNPQGESHMKPTEQQYPLTEETFAKMSTERKIKSQQDKEEGTCIPEEEDKLDLSELCISDRFQVSPDGTAVKLGGCGMTFPPGALQEQADATISLDYDVSKGVDGYTGIFPITSCELHGQELLLPVKVEVVTWYDLQPDQCVDLFWIENDGPWSKLNKLSLSIKGRKIQFESNHFSKFWLSIRKVYDYFINSRLWITSFIYHDDIGNFTILFCLDDNVIVKECTEVLEKRGCILTFPFSKTNSYPLNQEIKFNLVTSEGFNTSPPDGLYFYFDPNFKHNDGTVILQTTSATPFLDLVYTIAPKDRPDKKIVEDRMRLKYPIGIPGGGDSKYDVIDKVEASRWPRFARDKLGLVDSEIDNIQADYKDNTEEQKYRMLQLWKKKSKENTEEKLRSLADEFYTKVQ